MLEPNRIQADFPILQRKIHADPGAGQAGKRLIYLDSAATSQKPRQVIDAISNYYLNHNANVHRGIHQLGDESTKIFHASRKTIAQFFGADPTELIITRNTTEAINQVALTWGEAHITQDDIIITSEMEHHSNLVPLQELCARKRAQLILVDVDEQGRLNRQPLTSLVKTHGAAIKLIALTHVSNALGTLVPIAEIIADVRRSLPSVKFLIDGAQAAPHIPVNFHNLDADFYAVSAHKMLGPMGIGALFVKKDLLAELPPLLFGGGMIREVQRATSTFTTDPEERFTAGTPDVAGLVGWAAACEYLQQIGMAKLQEHDEQLVKATLTALQHFPQVKIVGPTQFADTFDRIGSVAFLYNGVHAHDVGQILDSEGVAVRSGHHCTMPLHTKFGWPATVRVSFQLYNTLEDIEVFVYALKKVQTIFKK